MQSLIKSLKFMKQRAWLYVFSIIAMAVLKAMLDVVTSRFVNRTYSLFELHNYSTILTEAGKSILTGAVLILIWRFFFFFTTMKQNVLRLRFKNKFIKKHFCSL